MVCLWAIKRLVQVHQLLEGTLFKIINEVSDRAAISWFLSNSHISHINFHLSEFPLVFLSFFKTWKFPIYKLSKNLSQFPFEASSKLEVFHFFLPHGLKLAPPLSQPIFAINSPLWFNFAFLSWNIIVKCELNFSAILFTHIPESFFEIQICISVWNENLRGTGVETKLASLKGFYTGGLPPLKRRFVIPAGLVLVAIIWPTRAWYRP